MNRRASRGPARIGCLLLLLLSLHGSAASGIDCTLNEKVSRWTWHSVEAVVAENGSVTVPFTRCPGLLTVRLVQNGEITFRAESEQSFLSGEIRLRAGEEPMFSPGLAQTYPSEPVVLRPGRYVLHFVAGGEMKAATIVEIPDPNKLSKLVVGDDDVRLYVGPRTVFALTLRSSDGTMVWDHRLSKSVCCVKLRFVSGFHDLIMTSGPEDEATEVNLGRFELERSQWYELEAEGPNGTYAAYFPMP